MKTTTTTSSDSHPEMHLSLHLTFAGPFTQEQAKTKAKEVMAEVRELGGELRDGRGASAMIEGEPGGDVEYWQAELSPDDLK